MTAFYRDVLELPLANQEAGWIEFLAGDCSIALHQWDGEAPEGPMKLVFYSDDVSRDRDTLVARGAPMAEIVPFGAIDLCDGVDPDGNGFQLSSRPRPTADSVS